MTVVEGSPKAPFSTAIIPRCQGRHYSFPWIAPLYPWYLPYCAECYARRYQVPFFESLVWLDLGLKPSFLVYWWTLDPLVKWACMYVYIHQTPGSPEGSDTRSIFMQSSTGLNSDFPSPLSVAMPKAQSIAVLTGANKIVLN